MIDFYFQFNTNKLQIRLKPSFLYRFINKRNNFTTTRTTIIVWHAHHTAQSHTPTTKTVPVQHVPSLGVPLIIVIFAQPHKLGRLTANDQPQQMQPSEEMVNLWTKDKVKTFYVSKVRLLMCAMWYSVTHG